MSDPYALVGAECRVDCSPPDSFNCWELVKYVRKHTFTLDTPHIASTIDYEHPDAFIKTLLEEGYISRWSQIERDYIGGDVCLLATEDKNLFNHVGVFLSSFSILHATPRTVMCTSLPVLRRGYKNIKVLRWPFVTS